MSQILQQCLTKGGRVRKFVYYLIWTKEPCIQKSEGLTRSTVLGFFASLSIETRNQLSYSNYTVVLEVFHFKIPDFPYMEDAMTIRF